MSNKKGFTLVEFIVAVTIFVIVMTVAVGSIVSLSRLKIMIVNMKNTQQKARISLEYITRYSKEAEKITVSDQIGSSQQWKTVVLQFPSVVSVSAKKISIQNTDLVICDYDVASNNCKSGTDFKLLGGGQSTMLDSANPSYFVLNRNTTSDLEVKLNIKSSLGTSTFLNDAFTLDTIALLENLK